MDMTCPKCGLNNGETARFCRHCANPLSSESRPSVSQGPSGSLGHQAPAPNASPAPPQSYGASQSAPFPPPVSNGPYPGQPPSPAQEYGAYRSAPPPPQISFGSYPAQMPPQPPPSYGVQASAPQQPGQASYGSYPSAPPPQPYPGQPSVPPQPAQGSYGVPPQAPQPQFYGGQPPAPQHPQQPSYGNYPQAPPQQSYGTFPSAPQYPPQPAYGAYPSPPPQQSYGSQPLPPQHLQASNGGWPAAPAYPSGQHTNADAMYGNSQMQLTGPGPNPYTAVVPAPVGSRIGAYLIDCIPVIVAIPVLVILSLIPFVGGLFAALLYVPYWLLRDINGASMGKRAMGLEIIQVDGTQPRAGPRVIRNITLWAPALLHIIPFIGPILHALFALFVIGAEIILVLVGSRRIGDRLAGTMVVRKRL